MSCQSWRVVRRAVVVALLLGAVAVAAGCSSGDDDDDTASATTTSTTTTTTTSTTSAAKTDCWDVAPKSSPATFDDDHGTYSAYITAASPASRDVTYDVVQWLSGDAAADAYHRDYPDDPDGPPNDYYIVNASPQLRTSRVTDGEPLWLLATVGDAASLAGRSFDDLAADVGATSATTGYRTYWLTFDKGTITNVCEQYRP